MTRSGGSIVWCIDIMVRGGRLVLVLVVVQGVLQVMSLIWI
jgi:hypothetical protein